MKRFDRKFGSDFLAQTTTDPAVYLFFDEGGGVLYVGKAKNARRRLAQYRNASRRKAHRKMRMLVREASHLEVRPQPTEAAALLEEDRLIKELRPPLNVDGAFDFLYPAIGACWHDGRILLALTSEPEVFDAIDLTWHGTFRPRWRAKEAFDSMAMLLGHLGHPEPRSRLPLLPNRRGARLVAFRRVPKPVLGWIHAFLDGEGNELVPELSTQLLEPTSARHSAGEMEIALKFLADFYTADARRLRSARISAGYDAHFVPGWQRDELFIRVRTGLSDTIAPKRGSATP